MDPVKWPAWRYGPNGAAAIFQQEAEVPAGWVDHPSKVLVARSGIRKLEGDELEAAKAAMAAFDHDGDGKPGGSLPKAERTPDEDQKDAFDKVVDAVIDAAKRVRRKVKRNDPRI